MSTVDVGKLLGYARSFLGVPYLWGGTTPGGFDCSGFVQYVYAHFGVSLPRTTYQQIKAGRPVTAADARAGDLVFTETGSHVMIYLGGGKAIEAPHSGDVVKITSFSPGSAYAIRRVVDGSAGGGAADYGVDPGSSSTGSTYDGSTATTGLSLGSGLLPDARGLVVTGLFVLLGVGLLGGGLVKGVASRPEIRTAARKARDAATTAATVAAAA